MASLSLSTHSASFLSSFRISFGLLSLGALTLHSQFLSLQPIAAPILNNNPSLLETSHSSASITITEVGASVVVAIETANCHRVCRRSCRLPPLPLKPSSSAVAASEALAVCHLPSLPLKLSPFAVASCEALATVRRCRLLCPHRRTLDTQFVRFWMTIDGAGLSKPQPPPPPPPPPHEKQQPVQIDLADAPQQHDNVEREMQDWLTRDEQLGDT
ncbi:hypothetical protein Scep_009758 [Stephania cephalantha]|uniref:Uncharacterized protein n=1 Tax=Stephania cephalantha TaxID=152367 RepID=A0AAP0PDF9_9MAGN